MPEGDEVVRRLLRQQSGVVSRRQVLAAGLRQHDVRRLLRRREWARVHPGVYVDHTGRLSWLQRAWAAVLVAEPAALCGGSALRAADGPGRRDNDDTGPIHVAVARGRTTLVEPAGVEIHHLAHPDDRYLWNLSPPRLRYEEAALDVACAADTDLDAVAALARACGSRRTTARRLAASLAGRARASRRDWLRNVLCDVAEGTCSVLEHGYLDLVERPHGLPRAARQLRATSSAGVVYRDAAHDGLLVELDGRLFHDSAEQRDRDLERDLDAARGRLSTVRLGWGQVFGRPCSTAAKLADVFTANGIGLSPRACGPGCRVAVSRAG